MIALDRTARISSKGQVTLPKRARDALGSDVVRVLIDDDGSIRLEPVPDLAASLARYAEPAPHPDESDAAWEAEMRARHEPAQTRAD
jgi:bifunctional DNA-binding transcriptional regulator/antitoxin component of YhaV-PrlF toxin-antitoxin module